MSPIQLRSRLNELRLERVAAMQCDLGRCRDYMADLDAEEAECLEALTIATVTEIALLRAKHTGPLEG